MKNIIIRILLLAVFLSLITIPSYALVFPDFTTSGAGAGGTGAPAGTINTGNGFFNDDAVQFGYSGTRNVYLVTETNQTWIFEPISYAAGGSASQVINSSFNTLKDAVVLNGYVYFIDGTDLKKRKSRSSTGSCESNDTAANGCIQIIASSIKSEVLRVYNGRLYYWSTTSAVSYLDDNDNPITLFSGLRATRPTTTRKGLAVTTQNNDLTIFFDGTCGAGVYCTVSYNSSGEATIYTGSGTTATIFYPTYVTLQNYVYQFYSQDTVDTNESIISLSNNSVIPIDYITSSYAHSNRLYIGSQSTVGLWSTSTQYQTVNALESGIDGLTTSEGSGLVEYVSKSVDVPNSNYYNDSIIPINVDLKFIITNENYINYKNTLFWHLRARDPTGIEVEDHDLPVICNQNLPWWDTFGVFTLFLVDNEEPWACDGTQTVQYSPTPGTRWDNGTYEVDLTEQIPGTTSVLGTDSWNIVNSTSGGTGTISPPSVGGGTDIQGRTDDFLSSGMMITFIMLIIFAAIGNTIGGMGGAAIGFGGGFLFSAAFGLIPNWALFLFAILIIVAFSAFASNKIEGGGQG